MRIYLVLFILLNAQSTFGQFAIIQDKDGFANVRGSASISSEIIDTIQNGQIVFCLEADNDWFPIDYDLTQQRKTGYIHKSRVKSIDDLTEVHYTMLSTTSVLFRSDMLKLTITKIPFNPKTNKLQYFKGDPQKDEATYLEKINGNDTWGTDGNVPRMQYGQFLLELGDTKIHLPKENLYEPNLDYTSVNIDPASRTIYISTYNSDGAGAYAVLWIINNGKYKQRIITIPF